MKVIGLASDHNGIVLKEKMRLFLKEEGFVTIDIGPYDIEKKVDYVDYANQLSQMIANKDLDGGILICGTGIGMSIAANRHSHIRAALCTDEDMARLSRQHNDANVLVIGGRTTSLNSAKKIIDVFVSTEFEKGRHTKRLKKIS